MNDTELLWKLSQILGDLLNDTTIELAMETTRADVPEWDSFSYVNFIVAVEAEFGVQFRVADVESFENIGDIVREIQKLNR